STYYQTHARVARSGSNRFLLNPLSERETRFLRTRNPQIAAYQEYFNLSQRNVSEPIWHQEGQNLNRFYYLCRLIVDFEDRHGESPSRIPVLEQWRPTTIPPLQSHLDWDPDAPPSRFIGRAWGPQWMKRIERLAELARFRPRDYVGYRK